MSAAAFNDNPLVLTELIKAGANVNAKDEDGRTALMSALVSYESACEIVVELIKAGADVNARDKNGKTVLDIAKNIKEPNAPQIIEILTKAGAK